MRRKVVTVVGDGARAYREKSVLVGDWIAHSGFHLLTGGGGGVMAEVTESFVECVGRGGVACGIIPGSAIAKGTRLEYSPKGAAYPNPSVELAVFTHLPGVDPEAFTSRNHINVLSGDLIVALPGGVGTHAEIQLAKQYGKPALLFLDPSEGIGGKSAAALAAEGFVVVSRFEDLMQAAARILDPERAGRSRLRLQLKWCIVRSWRLDDARVLQQEADNRKVWDNLFDGFPRPFTIRDARRWLVHSLCATPETNFAIEVDGAVAGSIGFEFEPRTALRSAEIGYWLGERFWGRGIATNALIGLTEYAFENFPELIRLSAHVFPWNQASARVLQKAGYAYEATLRHSAMKSGRSVDMLLFAKVRHFKNPA